MAYLRLLLVCVLMVIITAIVQPSIQEEIKITIGQLSSCDHDVKGEVIAVNKRQIIIKGLHYDGKGPGAYFTAMKKPALKVQPAGDVGDKFVIIPDKEAVDKACEVFSYGMAISGKDVKLDLPEDLTSYETIGIYCHQYCNNFGHVNVTGDFSALAEPKEGEWTMPSDCKPLSHHFKHSADKSKNCADEKNIKNADLHHCDLPTPMKVPTTSGATQFHPSMAIVVAGMGIFGLMKL